MEFVDNNKGRLRGAMPSTMARALAACVLFLSIPYAQAAVDTFQEGVSSYSGTQDTFLEQNTPDTSHDESLVKVENDAPQVQHGLIRFDNIFGNGAGQIPYGSIINSASLTVEVDNVSSAGAQIRLHRMLVTWPESATWNSMTNGIQTDDVEAMSVHDAQVADPASTGPQVITGLAAALQAWSYGAANHGWAFISNSADGWDIDSSEAGTTAHRPLLTVDWSPGICPGGNVTNTNDTTNNSSLRACVIWANAVAGTDTITVPAGTYTLTIAGTGEDAANTGDLDITDDVIINGHATNATIVNGNSLDRVFDILGADVTMTNLTIQGGDVTADGAGVAIDATGSLTMTHSTVSGNTTTADGGGIATAGGSVDLTNVTLSVNTADQGGGLDCAGSCTLTNVTVTSNIAPTNGDGLRLQGGGAATVVNSIVANNLSAGATECDGAAVSLTSNGYNISSDASCDFTSTGDQENTDPSLGALQDNGGPTFTHAIADGSRALDAGDSTVCVGPDNNTDQRGSARPLGVSCDIGSYEAAAIAFCTVTTVADTGLGSLRNCITYANSNPGITIRFDIAEATNRSAGADDWWAITPASALPPVTAANITIDATTQTTNQGDTNSGGPEVEIDGTGAGASTDGLVLGATSTGSTIRGLAINNFSDNGILMLGGSNTVAGNYVGLSADGTTLAANNTNDTAQQGGIRVESASNTIGGTVDADRNVISGNNQSGIGFYGAGATGNDVYGNYIGLDAGGTLDRGNTEEGIDFEFADNNTVGGPLVGQRNIISGNDSDGVEIDDSDDNVVQNNYIGTDYTGVFLVPNTRDGIDINEEGGDGATGNLIGGTGANEGNLIRGNGIYGVQVRDASTTNNSILRNRIYDNVALDIDLNDDGISANDANDADAGPNDILNYPNITKARHSSGTLTVDYTLDVPAGDYRIEFFKNPGGAHGSGNGGGESYASADSITHSGSGLEIFSHVFPGSAGDIITATATEELAGPTYDSTSEFSNAMTALGDIKARWPLDETSGLTAFDIIASNNGTYTNGVSLNQAAACVNTGNAAYFDGLDDFVEIPHSADYLLDEGTVTLWARIDALGTEEALLSKDSSGLDTGGHLTITVQPGGDVQVRLQSTTLSYFVNSAPISAATWFHVAFSWGPDGMALSIDGGLPVTDPYTGGLGTTSGGAGNFEPIALGAGTIQSGDLVVTPTEDHFNGYLDDVRIYDGALSQSQITALASCTPPAVGLSLVKRAFWLDGTPIPTGATIPGGVEFKYLLYINNQDGAETDVSVRDVLDPLFVYQTGTIQVDNSVSECAAASCTPAEEQTIFSSIDATPFLNDAVDGDVASFTAGTTIDAGDEHTGNAQLNISGDSVWAILFSVKMP
jgi:hypothetical protein